MIRGETEEGKGAKWLEFGKEENKRAERREGGAKGTRGSEAYGW